MEAKLANWAIDIRAKRGNDFFINSNRKVTINAGDNIIAFYRHFNDVTFSHFGTVEAVFQLREGYERTFQIKLSKIEELKNEVNLEAVKFSLVKIYRFNNPKIHFRRAYLSLTEGDFETILNGEIYWPRTAFGFYASKLGDKQLRRFVKAVATDCPSLLLNNEDISLAWSKLREFIEQEFVIALDIINQISERIQLFNERSEDYVPFEKIGIELGYSKNNNRYQIALLHKQQRLLTEFVTSLQGDEYENIFELIEGRIKEGKMVNDRFEKIFKGVKWPLQLMPTL